MPSKKSNELPEIEIPSETEDSPRIIWLPISKAIELLWERNPKEHDIGALVTSIQRYGFQELPKYDSKLGAIKSGNGRVEAVARMFQQGMDLPRGIVKIETGEWIIPVMVGTDAQDKNEAIAYAIDANNLTLMGGSFTPFEMVKMWDESALYSILRDLAAHNEFAVSLDADFMDMLCDEKEEKEIAREQKKVCPRCGMIF